MASNPWAMALDATVQAVVDALASIKSKYGGQLTTTAKNRFRREFNTLDTTYWTDISAGAGASAVASAGTLVLTSGVASGGVAGIVGKRPLALSVPTRIAFAIRESQKIANQELYIELVAINDDDTIDDTCVLSWRVAFADSATATIARMETRNGGTARTPSANLTINTITADGILELQIEVDESWGHARLPDNNTSRTLSNVLQKVSPDPNRNFVPRVRIINGALQANNTITGAVPASSTTVTVSYIVGSDYTDVQAEILGGSGDIATGRGLPVNVGNTPAVTLGSTAIAAAATVVGTTPTKVNSAASVNNTLVKASAGRIYGWDLHNTGAAVAYLKLYNKITVPVQATDIPFMVVPLPAGAKTTVSMTVPIAFATGIAYAITGAIADTDATAVAASQVVGSLQFI